MRARATQVKSLEWRAILRPANQWPKSKNLIQSLFAVISVSAAETILLFEIERRNYLACHNLLMETGRISFQLIDHISDKLIAPRGPVAFSQLIRRELHVNRHHVFSS